MENLAPPCSYPPITVEIDSSAYPGVIQNFLRQNRADSDRFVREATDRQRWLQNHAFRVTADLCIDGRVSDFSEALGLSTGLLEMYRSGGAMDFVDSWRYARLGLDGNRKLRQLPVGGVFIKEMAEMRFVVVHHSASRPNDASCAAWKHNTKAAVEGMRRHADVLNESFRGHMAAIVALVDTDFDAITVVGPNGKLCTAELAQAPVALDRTAQQMLEDRLRDIYPIDWTPIKNLSSPLFANAFFTELAGHLLANAAFVREVIESKRPIELLDHQERLIFVGRPLETRDHNAAFLIGDTENLLFFRREDRLEEILASLKCGVLQRDVEDVVGELEMGSDFGIAFRIVLGNIVDDVIREGNRDFQIPVLISIPHDEDDRVWTSHYALALKARLLAGVRRIRRVAVQKLLTSGRLNGKRYCPEWLPSELDRLEEHVAFCTTVHDRRTRLFVPCD
ncbi:MAG TPA: hypothetical protein VN397_00880 [Candidatus Methylomirabilis sp.]|nr:hypothetical protein [Candidatus Methylomirabilis sp.]